MREIIPIKKDFLFKTKIGEITNIDLDHEYKINDNLVEGKIFINGSYKMTEASVLEDDFNYTLPFKVSISKVVNKESIKIDIDDFKYDIKNDILCVNIDLLFTCEEKKENPQTFENPIEENEVIKEETIQETDINENINSITNIVNNDNKYYTYKIYIVREYDTIDSICLKYNTSIDELKEFNDINDIHEGVKLIIPYINE